MAVWKKLCLAFGSITIVLLTTGTFSYLTVDRLTKTVMEFVKVKQPLDEAVLEMEINAKETETERETERDMEFQAG